MPLGYDFTGSLSFYLVSILQLTILIIAIFDYVCKLIHCYPQKYKIIQQFLLVGKSWNQLTKFQQMIKGRGSNDAEINIKISKSPTSSVLSFGLHNIFQICSSSSKIRILRIVPWIAAKVCVRYPELIDRFFNHYG